MNHQSHKRIKIILNVLFCIAACFFFYGAWKASTAPTLSVVAGGSTTSSTSPISVGPISVFVVRTQADQELGLGERASLPPSQGMLFVFKEPDLYGIWMKDMQFPIDIIWLDANFRIVTIETNVSPDTYPKVFYPAQNSSYVLETNANFSVKNNWRVGQSLLFLKQAVNNS